jgi:hypothetical protein
MGDRLKKNYMVCAMAAVLGACQTPTATNQGAASSRATAGTGQSVSPSSRYEAESLGPLLPPSVFDQRGGVITKPP